MLVEATVSDGCVVLTRGQSPDPKPMFFLNSGLICKVSAGNENAYQTTAYLATLSTREPLMLPLVLGLRRWARVGS